MLIRKKRGRYSDVISDGIFPQILPEIDTLFWRDRGVVRIIVYPGPARPYFLRGLDPAEGTYVRIGSTNRRADENVVHALEIYSKGRTFDEEPVPDASSEARGSSGLKSSNPVHGQE